MRARLKQSPSSHTQWSRGLQTFCIIDGDAECSVSESSLPFPTHQLHSSTGFGRISHIKYALTNGIQERLHLCIDSRIISFIL